MENIVGKCCTSSAGKIIGGIVIAALLVGGGMALGSGFRGERGFERGGRGDASFGMMGRGGVGAVYGTRGGMMGGVFGNDENGKATRLFGVISKVENDQITVTNNAGKPEVIFSLPTTIIVSANAEVGLSSLKAGQNIVVMGSTNKTNSQFEAHRIQVTQ